MKIVFLSPESVYPTNTGGRIVVYNKIKYLSELGHEIYLYCVIDSDKEINSQRREMKKYCREVFFFNRNKRKINKYLNSVIHPFSVGSRTIKSIETKLELLLKEQKVDIIWCETPQMAANIMKIKNVNKTKIVLSQQNIESNSMRSISKTFTNPVKRTVYGLDAIRLGIFEKSLYKSGLFDAYVFVSDEDKKYFETNFEYGKKPTTLVPIGAEDHGKNKRKPGKNVIIVGKMSYRPNVDGVMWFYENVWKKIKSVSYDVKLFIVGKDPDERIRSIKDDTVIVTGTVDSVEPYYEKGAVAVIPVFSGGGVKTKLIEASSFRIPIVCTVAGATGTKFRNNESIWITDNPNRFAECIIKCLEGGSYIDERVNNAYSLFEKEYTWKGIVNQLNEFLTTLTH